MVYIHLHLPHIQAKCRYICHTWTLWVLDDDKLINLYLKTCGYINLYKKAGQGLPAIFPTEVLFEGKWNSLGY